MIRKEKVTMRNLFYTLVIVLLQTGMAFGQTALHKDLTIPVEKGVSWWVGVVNNGEMMPIQNGYSADLHLAYGNEVQPLMISDHGDLVWSEDPYLLKRENDVYRKLRDEGVLLREKGEEWEPAMIRWWNGVSAFLDLSNPSGLKWFKDQLDYLQDTYGVDGFKLDGGDYVSFLPGADEFDAEIIVRAAQTHALMPMMQFSLAPWRVLNEEQMNAVKKAAQIRKEYTPTILLIIFFSSCSENESVRFAVCTDVHQDIIHDAPVRISTFVEDAKNEKVDFVIQLGDFCFPTEENKPFLKIWNLFPGQKFHVLGNHDMDSSSKQEEMKFLGMKNPYYSFDQGAFHFIVLDPNFFIEDDKYVNYEYSNYFDHGETRGTIPPDQVEWLKKDIAQTNKLVVVFSHQKLFGDENSGVKNRQEIRQILETANLSKQKVIACFSGHDHVDNHTEINGIHYIQINSMSYEWVGEENECPERFSEEINEFRPNLKYTLPYANPVFAIVEIDTDGFLTIKGRQGAYILPGPNELDIDKDSLRSPSVSDRSIEF